MLSRSGDAVNASLIKKWNDVIPRVSPQRAEAYNTCTIIVDSKSL